MNYTDVTRVFDYLESTDGVVAITPANLSDFVAHTQSINPDGDIVPGSVNIADISFSVRDIRVSALLYTNKEFHYYKGYADTTSHERLSTPASVYVSDGAITAYARSTTLTVEYDGPSWSTVVSAVPGCLVLKGMQVIALYNEGPYAEVFTVSDTGISGPDIPDMTAYEQQIATDYANRGSSYYVDFAGGKTVEYEVTTQNGARYLDTTEYEVYEKGFFTASQPERGTGGVFSIVATDRMSRFDADCVSILADAVSGEITVDQLLNKLCTYLEVPLAAQDRHNADMKIALLDSLETCTGTQMLMWLGELMTCSWRINAHGELESVWFEKTDTQLSAGDYITYDYKVYETPPIDKVMVAAVTDAVTGIAGTGANALVINGNGFLPYSEQEELNLFAQDILTQASTIPKYRPGLVSGYANPGIHPGDVISVQSDDGTYENVCVSQMTETGFNLSITSSGNQKREVQYYGSKTNADLKILVDQLKKQTGEFPDMWAQSIEDAVKLITGGMGGTRVDLLNPETGKPSGTAYLFDSFDISTAQELLVINAGGMAFYDHGFNVEDPSASVPKYVVMDKHGQVNASAILTGSLAAGLIKTGRIQSFDGNTYFDLDSGVIVSRTTYSTMATTDEKWMAKLTSGQLLMGVEDDEGNVDARVNLFHASNYDAGYLELKGNFDSYSSQFMFGSDGLTFNRCPFSPFEYGRHTTVFQLAPDGKVHIRAADTTSGDVATVDIGDGVVTANAVVSPGGFFVTGSNARTNALYVRQPGTTSLVYGCVNVSAILNNPSGYSVLAAAAI